jgi:septal ring-binding cell division protein DamX
MSDWGSAFPEQEVVYSLILRNNRPSMDDNSGTLHDVVVRSSMPRNLEIQGASADRGNDPTIAGHEITYKIGSLKAGEAIEIQVYTMIKEGVDIGTILVAQGEALYDDLGRPLLSNIATVKVVGKAEEQAVAMAASADPYPSPAATDATDTPAAADATDTPAAADAADTPAAADAADTPVPQAATNYPTVESKRNSVRTTDDGTIIPLPATHTGVPLAGLLLLGLTLFTRTVRLHRARERI